jgi:anti-sigma-K factor RskA
MSEGTEMGETSHERWQEDVAAFVLGALEPERAAALERHLEGCERCQAEVRWLTPAADALPEAVERIEPPRELRARLLADVRAEAPAAERERRPSLGERLRGSGSRSLVLRPAFGLAVLALAVAVAVGLDLGGDSGGGETTISAGRPPGITAKMVAEGEAGTLRLANVHQLADGKVLEAWVQRDGEVEPVQALFVPDRAGRASTKLPDMAGVEVVMVTAEPKGGSSAPTGEPLVTIPVPQ